jgi:pantothenate kinase type III
MPDYNLLIDIGNTFLKWGLFRNGSRGSARDNRLESGHALLAEIPALALQFAKFRAPAQIIISNVAGHGAIDDYPCARSLVGCALPAG